jgi:protease I
MAHESAHKGKPAAELDSDGLEIQKYHSLVLMVVPLSGYDEECLRYARSSLFNVHVGGFTVAAQNTDYVRGQFQDEFIPDGLLSETSMDGYTGVLFAGGAGARELSDNPDALRLAREAAAAKKMIAAWGLATAILANAAVVRGKRVTGLEAVRELVQRAGGKFTGRQLEVSGKLVTASDSSVGMRFGRALAEIVRI